ncbi:hypothetical protein [Nocardia sp. NPDC049149]|uniref:hypothetical protein n=1 Tax=Nocardia sp. NPDC049149 TaxID=3364315 RepID=UPI003714CE08
MNIDPNDVYAGMSMLEFRDRLRALGKYNVLYDVCIAEQFDPVAMDCLLVDGYIEPTGEVDRDGDAIYRRTIKGMAVVNASAAKSVKRTTAEKALAGLLNRIEEVDVDPHSLWVVNQAVLFGSMLDESRDRISDVDVAIELIPHPDRVAPEWARQALFDAWYSRIPLPDGFPWRGEQQVLKFLKNRQRTLSLMAIDEHGIAGLGWGIPHKVLYDRSGSGQGPSS